MRLRRSSPAQPRQEPAPASDAHAGDAPGTPAACPPVPADGLVAELVGAELLVYDAVADVAHCLSPDAALVFAACDGLRDPAALRAATGLPAETVARALDDLGQLGLLRATHEPLATGAAERVRRREALKRLAKASAAAAAAPLIVSAALETPAAFASGGSGVAGQACMGSGGFDTCGPGLNCDPSLICVPQNCNIVAPCTPDDSCSLGIGSGTCQSVSYGTGSLCCAP